MYKEYSSSESQLNIGPQRLLDSAVKEFINFPKEKFTLTDKSKFMIALQTLKEDYRPSETVSCRDREKQIIETYVRQSLSTQGSSESLYVSGMPGIGKTLCVKEVVHRLEKEYQDSMVSFYLNGLCLKQPIDIFQAIYFHLTGNECPSRTAMYKLNEYFEKGIDYSNKSLNRYQLQFRPKIEPQKDKQKYTKMKKVIILDEVDYLRTLNQEVLYNIFEWTQKKKSKLIIIAISNTTNLPELLSGKVNSRIGNKRLVFPQYQSWQIEKILRERISNLDVFDDQAISFTCKKIAQCSSDIRKSLNVLREGILEFIYTEKQNKKNLRDDDLKNKKISVDVLSKVMDRIYRDLFVISFNQFPFCYKIILYVLARHFRNQTGACTIRKLQHMSSGFVKDNNNQLLSTLTDLKQLGIIKIHYSLAKKEARSVDFINMKQLKEEYISLRFGYEKIFYALQKESPEQFAKYNFRIDLSL